MEEREEGRGHSQERCRKNEQTRGRCRNYQEHDSRKIRRSLRSAGRGHGRRSRGLSQGGTNRGMGPGHRGSLQDQDKSREVKGSRNCGSHLPQAWRVRDIRQTLLGAKKIRRPRGSEIKIYTIGEPTYRIEVEAGSFEAAEKTLNLVTEEILDSIKKAGGEGRKIG